MRVLFIASEAEPMIKVGGLGDVAGALPLELQSLSNLGEIGTSLDVRLAIPFYSSIKNKSFNISFEGTFSVPTPEGLTNTEVYTLDLSGLPVYLLQSSRLQTELPVYTSDNRVDGDKFAFFSLAVLELCKHLGWTIDILHANDWHTALSVYSLNFLRQQDPFYTHTHSILSLHNLPYMGQGAQDALSKYGIPPSKKAELPEWARELPLPLGLSSADRIVAVSPTYAREILTNAYGCGLQDFLSTRKEAITGILNGLDIETWNPSTDPHICSQFNIQTLSLRHINKAALQAEFNFAQDPNIPLLILISRMDPQKGVDIAIEGLDLLQADNWQAIILGTGITALEESVKQLEARFPQNVRAAIRFDNQLSHRMYAGADIFMMPSRYEPCGIAQMAAMRYGCVPVASATGGLVDTVFDEHQNRTGFLFAPTTSEAFKAAMRRALDAYHDQAGWKAIQINGMQGDYSWKKSAKKYIDLYDQLIKEDA
jgi:starch synthase